MTHCRPKRHDWMPLRYAFAIVHASFLLAPEPIEVHVAIGMNSETKFGHRIRIKYGLLPSPKLNGMDPTKMS